MATRSDISTARSTRLPLDSSTGRYRELHTLPKDGMDDANAQIAAIPRRLGERVKRPFVAESVRKRARRRYFEEGWSVSFLPSALRRGVASPTRTSGCGGLGTVGH